MIQHFIMELHTQNDGSPARFRIFRESADDVGQIPTREMLFDAAVNPLELGWFRVNILTNNFGQIPEHGSIVPFVGNRFKNPETEPDKANNAALARNVREYIERKHGGHNK